MSKKFLFIFLVLLPIVYFTPFTIAYLSEETLTADIRIAHARGKTITIENGDIHYLDRGSREGRVIVMVHGFSTPNFIFEQNAEALIDAGFRVIQFDHFGRGWSDRPATTYDANFYDSELLQILNKLQLNEPVGLVGLSMGGAIAVNFVANHPSRVSGLFLLAPAGLVHSRDPDSLVNKIITTPVLGDWFWRVAARPILLKGREERSLELAEPNRLRGDVTQQMKYRGYFPALLSTYRHFPLRDNDENFKQASLSNIPISAIFGGADTIIPLQSVDRIKSLLPNANVSVIEKGTHGLNYENFNDVNSKLIDFFTSLN